MLLSKKQSEFCLSGYGYLEEIRAGEKCLVARIKVLTGMNADPTQSDEILLDCEVHNLALLSLLDPMYQARKRTHAVLLSFTCVYSGFGHYHSGSTQEDPGHMAMLRAKLVSVGEWYCDGHPAPGIDRLSTALSSQAVA